MIKLLIFDLDGTLMDTIQDITNAVNFAVQPLGMRPFPVNEITLKVGAGLTKLIEGVIPADGSVSPHAKERGEIDSLRNETLNRFLEYYTEHLLDTTHLYPQVEETLSRLGNYKKAVLSNKRAALTRRALEGTGIVGFFDSVLGSDSVSDKKPSPMPIFEVMKRFGMSRENTVIIGDSSFDIEAGRKAGILTIAVTYGYRDRDILKDADYMIDSFGELLDLLPKI
jgi:phosphoglycolate phosphatase